MAGETVPGVRAKLARARARTARRRSSRHAATARHRWPEGGARRHAGPDRSGARRAADRLRPRHAGGSLPAAGRDHAGPVRARGARLRRRRRRMRSGCTTTCRGCGSCRPRPILSNGGTERGLPISCFLNSVEDNLDGIVGTWTENVWLASNGGGIGTYWGGVRSIGETVKGCGQTSGIIPFVRVMDSLTLAISPGLAAPRLGGRLSRRAPPGDRGVHRDPQTLGRLQPQEPEPAPRHLHHRRVHARGARRPCRSPCAARRTARSLRTVNARALWQKILETRLQTGEPYLLFSDTVNRELAAAPARAGPQGAPVEPVQRDPAAHRQGSPRPRRAPRCAACRR